MKKIFQLINGTFKLSVLCAALSLSPAALGDTMVGFWNFNTGTADSVKGETLELVNANITGGTLNSLEGGGYAKATGANVSLTSVAIPTGASPFTISAFLKTSATNNQGIVGWGNYGAGKVVTAFRTNNEINKDGNGFKHYWWGSDYVPDTGKDAWGTKANSGQWNHVVATSSGSNQTVYLNGQLLGGQDATGHAVTNINFAIGATNSNFSEKLNGSIDNASVYSTEMSHADIINIASSRYNGLTAQWVGSDLDTTSGKWVDRINGATADKSAGTAAISDSGGVVFDGNTHYTVSATDSPMAGVTDFTMLVSFSTNVGGKTSSETGDSTAWYQNTCLVDNEINGADSDWGLAYMPSGKLIGGLGNPDTHIVSTSNVNVSDGAPVSNTIAGYTVRSGNMNLYFNGTSEASASGKRATAQATNSFMIGTCQTNSALTFTGDINEIRIFDRALVSSEVAYYSGEMATDHAYVIGSDPNAWTAGNTAWVRDAATVDLTSQTFTSPLGLYVGGTTGKAIVKMTQAQANGINRTLVLGGGALELVTENTGSGLTKTIDIDGGPVTVSDSLNFFNDSRLTVTTGSLLVNNCMRVGCSGSGSEVVQKGGSVTVKNWFTMGEGGGSSYTLEGGTLAVNTTNGATDRCTVIGNTAGTSTFTMTGGTFDSSNAVIQIGKWGGATGVLTLSGGEIKAPQMLLGMAGKGTMNYGGGTLTIPDITVNSNGNIAASACLNLGYAGVEKQMLTLDGGSYVNNQTNYQLASLYVGTNGNAEVVVKNNGVLHLPQGANNGELDFGRADGKTGTLTLQSGSVKAGNTNIAKTAGSTGIINQTGGSMDFTGWFTMADQGGSGTYNLSGGSMQAARGLIGNAGTGQYTQTGGTAVFTDYLTIAKNNGSSGVVDVKGGKLSVANALTIGDRGTGTMNLSGGYVSAKSIAKADNLTWTDGTLAIGESVSGNLTQKGGTLMVGVPTFESGLNWKRNEFATLAEGYPGWASEWHRKLNADGSDYLVTAEENAAFWDKVSKTTPVASGTGTFADSVAGLAEDKKYFTVVGTANILIDTAGTYFFSEKSDDGAFLYIDGQEVVSTSTMKPGSAWGIVDTNSIELSAGFHSLEYRYYQGFGGWGIAGVGKQSSFLSWGTSADSLSPIESSGVLFNYDPVYAHVNILGDYTQAEDATLILEINPVTGEYDSITVDGGNLAMNGSLELKIFGGDTNRSFNFDVFEAIHGADLDFNFDSIKFIDGYNNAVLWNLEGVMAGGDGVLRYAGVPEPTTWALLVLGVAGLFVLRKRRA